MLDISLLIIFFVWLIILDNPEYKNFVIRKKALKNGDTWYVDPRGAGRATLILENFLKSEKFKKQIEASKK